jgi:hypothetical protein
LKLWVSEILLLWEMWIDGMVEHAAVWAETGQLLELRLQSHREGCAQSLW